MKIISWNVNGLRAAITKGFYDFFNKIDNLITLHECKLAHLQTQKKALLQQMFV